MRERGQTHCTSGVIGYVCFNINIVHAAQENDARGRTGRVEKSRVLVDNINICMYHVHMYLHGLALLALSHSLIS